VIINFADFNPGKLTNSQRMNRLKHFITDRKDIILSRPGWLMVIILFALAARLAYLMIIVGPHSFPQNIDSIEHHLIARNLVRGEGYSLYEHLTAYRAPFLTYFMALNYLIFGQNFALIRIEMILMSLLLVWSIYLLAKELFDGRIALWAALIAAVYPHLIFYSARIYTEIPFTLFSVLAILYFARYIKQPSGKCIGLTSLFLALAILTRPVGFALMGFMLLYILFRQPKWQNVRNMVILFILVFLFISPWMVRNYRVFGKFIPVTSQAGVVLWVSNNHYVAHHPLYRGEIILYQYLPGTRNLIVNDEIERSRYAFHYFSEFLKNYPGDIPILIRNKAVHFWEKDFLTGSSRKWMYEYSYLIILFLAVVGVFLTIIYRKNNIVYLWILFLANFLPALIFWAGARIRLPAEPVLIIFAAFTVEEIRKRLKRINIFRSMGILSLLITAFFSCRSASQSPLPAHWVFRSDMPSFFLQNLDSQRVGIVSANSCFIIRKSDGKMLKRIRLTDFGISGGAVLEDRRIYYDSPEGYFYCDDLQSEKNLWKFPVTSGKNVPPVIDGQTLYWGSADSNVYAIDKVSGQLKWKFRTGCDILARPLILDSLLFIGSWDTRLYALQKETGQKLWEFRAETGITQTPLPFAQSLWLSSYDYHIYEINLRNGKLNFDFVADNAFEFGGVQWGDTLIFSGIDRNFYFVDPFQRTVSVHGKSPVAISTRPVVDKDVLYTGQYDGCLYRWDLPSMKKTLLYRFDGRVLFMLSDGYYLWATSWDRRVACFSLNEDP
jgi:4-amino-4-deoxy-L-arabinose transferase-like glycosyltransferase